MKKSLVLGALLLLAGVINAGATSTPNLMNTSGTTLMVTGSSVLDGIVLGNTTGDAVLKVYDSATAAGISASNLKFTIGFGIAVTQTAFSARLIPVNAYFKNGVVLSTAGSTVTVTASTLTHVNN